MATPLPLFCIAGSDEGEIVMADWKTITDLERGSGNPSTESTYIVRFSLQK